LWLETLETRRGSVGLRKLYDVQEAIFWRFPKLDVAAWPGTAGRDGSALWVLLVQHSIGLVRHALKVAVRESNICLDGRRPGHGHRKIAHNGEAQADDVPAFHLTRSGSRGAAECAVEQHIRRSRTLGANTLQAESAASGR
jgi:hypothetical protein